MDANNGESKASRILRLIAEAGQGKAIDVSIPEAIEFRRGQYGLNQTEFAAVLGLHGSHYSEIIKGKRSLPIEATKRAFAIGVPAAVLLQPTKGGD